MKLVNVQTMMCVAVLSVASSAFATQEFDGKDAGDVYNALNVPAQSENHGELGVSKLAKEVGGVRCTRQAVVYPNAVPSFFCTVADTLNSEALYLALNIEEKNVTPAHLVGVGTMLKAVGGLECSKATATTAIPRSTYTCFLNSIN